jgi:aryl-alcohol dehydrogenase-like predicted oxidoreductase
MKHRKLGYTGLIVSEVALGSMQFGGKMNMGNLGQEDTTQMVKVALDNGVNFIDTADVYSLGESETLLGNALKGIRQEIVLATKVRLPMSENFNRSGATRVNILREVEGSLERLQTDYIDLYQVHGWDSNTPLEETLRTLDDLVRQGKVRYIGLSNLMSWQAATAVMLQERLGLERYVTAQMYYSLVGRGLEHEFQSFAEYHDIGILVWSPLAGGFLSGKYSRDNPAPAGSRFADAGQFVPFDREIGYRVVDAVKEVAARHGASPARVAISWLLGRPAVSSVIIAARKVEQLEDNIRAVDLRLSDDDTRQLDAASDPGIPYPKVDGPSARHRGGSAFQGSASRALRGGRSLEGPSRDAVVRLKGSVARARDKGGTDRGHQDERRISRERQANEKGTSSGRRELPVDPVLRGRCVTVGVSGPGAICLDDSGSRAHRHVRFQQPGLFRLVPGDKAASAGQAPSRILLAGSGVFERRAVHPDLLHGNDDPRRMEAREGRDVAQSAVSGQVRPGHEKPARRSKTSIPAWRVDQEVDAGEDRGARGEPLRGMEKCVGDEIFWILKQLVGQ